MEELKPGREFDALIAEKVFGLNVGWGFHCRNAYGGHFEGMEWSKEKFSNIGEDPYDHSRALDYQSFGWIKPKSECMSIGIKQYSTDIAAAWEVVEKLMERGEKLYIGCDPDNDSAAFSVSWPVGESVEAKTLPHAICLAAIEIT